MVTTKNLILALCLIVSVAFPAYRALEKSADSIREIKMSVAPGLRFDVPRFHVRPGQEVAIAFSNTDDMDHNLLILRPGSRQEVVELATQLGAEGHRDMYIPETPSVLWHTDVLHAGEQEELRFTAPQEEGVYPYVCTLPGHGHVMYGAMYVSETDDMPAMADDTAIPQAQRQRAHSPDQERDHPYDLQAPYHYRLYIEGASPAAIAVHLPGNLSYCWDASPCDLRLMWEGGFVDNTELWKGHKDAQAKIQGTVFYRQSGESSLIIGDGDEPVEEPQFKGYKILDGGYLEFHYQLGTLDVFETLRETSNKDGIVRAFKIPDLDKKLTLRVSPPRGTQCSYNGATITQGQLQLEPHVGKEFNVEYNLIK